MSNQFCREARYVNRTVALHLWPKPAFRPNAIEMTTIFALLKFCMVRVTARAKGKCYPVYVWWLWRRDHKC
jgi:hypothetical protein